MSLFEDLLTEFSRATLYLKYENHQAFLQDLERRLADLTLTKSILMSEDPQVQASIPAEVRCVCVF